MRLLHLLAFALILPLGQVRSENNLGAKAAFDALPPKYRDGVFKLSADDAHPNPQTWSIVAKSSVDGSVFNLEVAGGQLISERISLNFGAIFSNTTIDRVRVNVGSDGAWAAGQQYAQRKGKRLGSVSYALQQKGRDAAPIWSVWCYDPSGDYIGLLKILATNGAIVSAE